VVLVYFDHVSYAKTTIPKEAKLAYKRPVEKKPTPAAIAVIKGPAKRNSVVGPDFTCKMADMVPPINTGTIAKVKASPLKQRSKNLSPLCKSSHIVFVCAPSFSHP
jgi:hypothetical protein